MSPAMPVPTSLRAYLALPFTGVLMAAGPCDLDPVPDEDAGQAASEDGMAEAGDETPADDAADDAEDDAADDTADDTSGDTADTGPEACPGNPDPECTTAAACGNGEICVGCECVPQPEKCSSGNAFEQECLVGADCGPMEYCFQCECLSDCSNGPGACQTDDECSDGEVCTECKCVPPRCECGILTGCENPLDACDGCNCMACGSDTGFPVDPVGEEFPEVVVSGTTIVANVTGEADACFEALCVVEISNGLAANVFFNAVNSESGDLVFFSPEEGMIAPFETAVLELSANACNMPGEYTDRIFFQNADTLLELGPVDIAITLTNVAG